MRLRMRDTNNLNDLIDDLKREYVADRKEHEPMADLQEPLLELKVGDEWLIHRRYSPLGAITLNRVQVRQILQKAVQIRWFSNSNIASYSDHWYRIEDIEWVELVKSQ